MQSGRKLRVVYTNRALAFVANECQLRRLMAAKCVDIEYNTRNEPKEARLLVTLRVANACMLPPKNVRSGECVTRMKQDPGSGKWVQRADMAGRGAGSLAPTTIHFGLGHREATA